MASLKTRMGDVTTVSPSSLVSSSDTFWITLISLES